MIILSDHCVCLMLQGGNIAMYAEAMRKTIFGFFLHIHRLHIYTNRLKQ